MTGRQCLHFACLHFACLTVLLCRIQGVSWRDVADRLISMSRSRKRSIITLLRYLTIFLDMVLWFKNCQNEIFQQNLKKRLFYHLCWLQNYWFQYIAYDLSSCFKPVLRSDLVHGINAPLLVEQESWKPPPPHFGAPLGRVRGQNNYFMAPAG